MTSIEEPRVSGRGDLSEPVHGLLQPVAVEDLRVARVGRGESQADDGLHRDGHVVRGLEPAPIRPHPVLELVLDFPLDRGSPLLRVRVARVEHGDRAERAVHESGHVGQPGKAEPGRPEVRGGELVPGEKHPRAHASELLGCQISAGDIDGPESVLRAQPVVRGNPHARAGPVPEEMDGEPPRSSQRGDLEERREGVVRYSQGRANDAFVAVRPHRGSVGQRPVDGLSGQLLALLPGLCLAALQALLDEPVERHLLRQRRGVIGPRVLGDQELGVRVGLVVVIVEEVVLHFIEGGLAILDLSGRGVGHADGHVTPDTLVGCSLGHRQAERSLSSPDRETQEHLLALRELEVGL